MNKQRQQGSVLLISLGLLVVLTLMTFGISNSIIMQERLVADSRSDSLALEVAESALIDAESFLMGVEMSGFTKSGNQGLYWGECDYGDGECYALTDLPSDNLFEAEHWESSKSREASTVIPCSHGDLCPEANAYSKGRFKAIYLGEVSSGDSIRVITSQMQDANDTFLTTDFKLFKIIASGTSLNEENRRVVVSYFVAPVRE